MNGIIILAAGGSTRPGRPKQLLAYQGKTLLSNITDEAVRSATGPVRIVLGADGTRISGPAGSFAIVNENWKEGMGSSIRKGLSEMLKDHGQLESVMLAVGDQPFVHSALFRQLTAHKQTTAKGIIACSYKDTLGTPVLFDKKYFPALLALNGQQGAKNLINLYPEDVASVPFDLGEIEIDRPEDYFFLQ